MRLMVDAYINQTVSLGSPGIDNIRWLKPVRPGDSLTIAVEMLKMRGKIGKAKGICSVDGDPVSEADVTFVLTDA